MFNHHFDQDGIYIKNLSNTGDHYGIGQYRFPHNYELVGKQFTIYDGDEKHHLNFLRKDYMELDGKGREFESLKLEATTYFVRLGFDVAVVDLDQGLITLIQKDKYFYGKIEGQYVDGAEHKDAGDEMVGTGVAWVLGCGRYVKHEYFEEGKCHVSWAPIDEAKNEHPCKATKIKGPLFLVDIKGWVPYNTCAPILTERVIMLQDYDHMMTVGCVMGGSMTPIMISGYARFLDEENLVRIPGGAVISLDSEE
jgi:hypothetical protein